jgi:hypothetical protein
VDISATTVGFCFTENTLRNIGVLATGSSDFPLSTEVVELAVVVTMLS